MTPSQIAYLSRSRAHHIRKRLRAREDWDLDNILAYLCGRAFTVGQHEAHKPVAGRNDRRRVKAILAALAVMVQELVACQAVIEEDATVRSVPGEEKP